MTTVCNPIFPGVDDDRRIGFLDFDSIQPETQIRDLGEQPVGQILDRSRHVELLQFERLACPLHVITQRLVQRIVHVDQHAVVVFGLEQRFDLVVKLGEQRRIRTRPFDLEKAANPVAVPMQVATLVGHFFVSMSRVELVVLLNDHSIVSTSISNPSG